MESSHVVAIVAIVFGCSYAMFEAYVKAKSKKVNTVNEDELKKEIAALRNRLEVLEKIVTDEGYQLKKEIDSL